MLKKKILKIATGPKGLKANQNFSDRTEKFKKRQTYSVNIKTGPKMPIPEQFMRGDAAISSIRIERYSKSLNCLKNKWLHVYILSMKKNHCGGSCKLLLVTNQMFDLWCRAKILLLDIFFCSCGKWWKGDTSLFHQSWT